MNDYIDFIARKRPAVAPSGFEPGAFTAPLFPFQSRNVAWACRMGRCALFLDTGLGKTVQQLEWAHQVAVHTSGRVLILAPLAVAQQTVREALKFGIPGAVYVREPAEVTAAARIVVTNYERLAKFDPADFSGVVLDESSILKNYSGSVKQALCKAFERTPYKLACTATPAPNDHVELGNHSEFLGVMPSHDMLTRWFKNDTAHANVLRLKAHAVEDFWDWVASWAVMASLPSDLGSFNDAGYLLPEMSLDRHIVSVSEADLTPNSEKGTLFDLGTLNATGMQRERRRSSDVRAAKVAELVRAEPGESWIVWCETDNEADALMLQLEGLDAREIRGPDSPAVKEAALVDFTTGKLRILVTKPKIAGYGLNWQHCARVAFIGATFSFESYYQAIRRVWRFGQLRKVRCHVVMASTEKHVWSVLERKRVEHERMKREMFAAAMRRRGTVARPGDYRPTKAIQLPEWMSQ